MKLETSFRMVAVAGLTLVVWAFGCHTRTPIGEIPDAGEGNDGWLADGSLGTGTGGIAGGQGGRTGAGGDQPGSGGAGGALTGQGGMGGTSAMGGAPGTAACRTHANQPQRPDVCSFLTYPASGFYGDNILADDCTTFTSSVNYELGVMGATSATVQVTFTALTSLSGAAGGPGFPGWYYGIDGDWRAKAYDQQTQAQLFETRSLSDNQTLIGFKGAGSARVDIYECDLATPARSKIISWAPAQP